jgi:hypothetical protein
MDQDWGVVSIREFRRKNSLLTSLMAISKLYSLAAPLIVLRLFMGMGAAVPRPAKSVQDRPKESAVKEVVAGIFPPDVTQDQTHSTGFRAVPERLPFRVKFFKAFDHLQGTLWGLVLQDHGREFALTLRYRIIEEVPS